MKTLFRPDRSRIHRTDDWKQSAYAFVPYETHFGELCGFADDVVAPGRGFGMHPHRDMEISTILLAGAQRHEDSTGGKHLLGTNAVQTMSAGTGIRHSELNASATDPFHSYQIWVYPRRPGGAPRYETFAHRPEDRKDRFLLALSPDRRDGSAMIGQDAFFSVAALRSGFFGRYAMYGTGTGVYVHCASGAVEIAGQRLGPGDAIGIWEVDGVEVAAHEASELVLVEVPMARGVAT
jgi:redox-sensitive bicupin YhaK (pirin superfamily)